MPDNTLHHLTAASAFNFADSLTSKTAQLLESLPTIENNPAKWAYERLSMQIIEFEKELLSDDEIGATLVSTPGAGVFHVEDLGYWGPDFVIFHGENEHGKPICLIQHYTQVSILLTALPKLREQPRRIGFDLERKLRDEGSAS